jgi:hypothetical protein
MQWKAKPWPKLYELRKRTKFCLVPFKCTDDTVVWLERVELVEKYHGGGEWFVDHSQPVNPKM